MMKFKRNITITIACFATEFLISSTPVIFMVYLFFTDNVSEFFSALLIIPIFALIINAFLILISLFACAFLKTNFYVNKECLIVEKGNNVKTINYNEITGIAYDFGNYLSQYNKTPSQLVLFGEDHRQLLAVNNPSIVMVHMIKKKCKNVNISYYNNKRFLFLLAVINGTFLLIAILAKLFLL